MPRVHSLAPYIPVWRSCSGTPGSHALCVRTLRRSCACQITYFDGDGNGQLPRYALALCGMEFTDTRINYEQFTALKEAGKFPMGQVPVLHDRETGKTIGDSWTIARYACAISGLYPSDPWDAAVAEMIVSYARDIKGSAGVAWFKEPRDEAVEEWRTGKFAKLLAAIKSQYGDKALYGGDKPDYVDLCVYVALRAAMRTSDKITRESLSGDFGGLMDAFEAQPGVKAYDDKRKAIAEAASS